MYIKEIQCSIASFQTIKLNRGINFVIAEPKIKSSKDLNVHEKTNSVGKTTILEIIKYCFGQKNDSAPFKNIGNFIACKYSLLIGDEESDKFLISRQNGQNNFIVFDYFINEEFSYEKEDFLLWIEKYLFKTNDVFVGNPMATFLRRDVTIKKPFDISFVEKGWMRNSRILSCLGLELKKDFLIIGELLAKYKLETEVLKDNEVKEDLFGYPDKQSIREDIIKINHIIAEIQKEKSLFQQFDEKFINSQLVSQIEADEIKLSNEKLLVEINRLEKTIIKHNNKVSTSLEDKELIKKFESIFNLFVVESIEKCMDFHETLNKNILNFLNLELENMKAKYKQNLIKISKLNVQDYDLNYIQMLNELNIKEGALSSKKNYLESLLEKYYDDIKISTAEISTSVNLLLEKTPLNIIEDFIQNSNEFCNKLFPNYNIQWNYKIPKIKNKITGTKVGVVFGIKATGIGDGRSHLLAFLIDICLTIFGKFNFVLVHDSAIIDPIDRIDLAIALNYLEEHSLMNQHILLIRSDNIDENLSSKLKEKINSSLKLSTDNKLFGFNF